MSLVRITTDGSGTRSGPGGWAAVLRCGDQYKEISGAVAETTSNGMEITAAIMGLRELKRPCNCEVITDSEYLKESAKYRLQRWIANGWVTHEGQPVKNRELWQQLKVEIDRHSSVTWFWVKGHSGDPDNERCDVLAGAARASLLPPKPGKKKRPVDPKKVIEKLQAVPDEVLREALDAYPTTRDRIRAVLMECVA